MAAAAAAAAAGTTGQTIMDAARYPVMTRTKAVSPTPLSLKSPAGGQLNSTKIALAHQLVPIGLGLANGSSAATTGVAPAPGLFGVVPAAVPVAAAADDECASLNSISAIAAAHAAANANAAAEAHAAARAAALAAATSPLSLVAYVAAATSASSSGSMTSSPMVSSVGVGALGTIRNQPKIGAQAAAAAAALLVADRTDTDTDGDGDADAGKTDDDEEECASVSCSATVTQPKIATMAPVSGYRSVRWGALKVQDVELFAALESKFPLCKTNPTPFEWDEFVIEQLPASIAATFTHNAGSKARSTLKRWHDAWMKEGNVSAMSTSDGNEKKDAPSKRRRGRPRKHALTVLTGEEGEDSAIPASPPSTPSSQASQPSSFSGSGRKRQSEDKEMPSTSKRQKTEKTQEASDASTATAATAKMASNSKEEEKDKDVHVLRLPELKDLNVADRYEMAGHLSHFGAAMLKAFPKFKSAADSLMTWVWYEYDGGKPA